MFFLGEYINMVTVSAIATTLFPRYYYAVAAVAHPRHQPGWLCMLWWLIKVAGFLYFFIWLRGTLPRLRYDQFMAFGWRVLIPVSLLWIVLVLGLRVVRSEYAEATSGMLTAGGHRARGAAGDRVLPVHPQARRTDAGDRAGRPGAHLGHRHVSRSPMPGQTFEYTPAVIARWPVRPRPRPSPARPPLRPRRDPMPELPPPRGFWVTFRTQFEKVTEQYPEQKDEFPPKPRFHGRHQLNRYPDGLEKCIGCELCVGLSADAIYVQGADNSEAQRFSP